MICMGEALTTAIALCAMLRQCTRQALETLLGFTRPFVLEGTGICAATAYKSHS